MRSYLKKIGLNVQEDTLPSMPYEYRQKRRKSVRPNSRFSVKIRQSHFHQWNRPWLQYTPCLIKK